MPQQIKVLAAKPNDLNSSPMVHVIEVKNQLLQAVL